MTNPQVAAADEDVDVVVDVVVDSKMPLVGARVPRRRRRRRTGACRPSYFEE